MRLFKLPLQDILVTGAIAGAAVVWLGTDIYAVSSLRSAAPYWVPASLCAQVLHSSMMGGESIGAMHLGLPQVPI